MDATGSSRVMDATGSSRVMDATHPRPGRPEARIAFAPPDHVTILDLGPWGAVHTRGWDRGTLVAHGAEAKAVKQSINGERIIPPRDGDRAAILAAAAPLIQAPAAAQP